MNHQELKQRLPAVTETLVKSIHAHPTIQHLGRVSLPNRDAVIECLALLRQLLFPGYFGKQGLTEQGITYRVGELVGEISELLYEQIRASLRYKQLITDAERASVTDRGSLDDKAAEIVARFFDRVPAVRELLATDVQAAIEGDPAAHDADETIFCYPGIHAISVQRLAHELWNLGVPLLPRMMTEHAHGLTGVDIHPGAKIGRSFFIDHGTGVVIGETSVIGNNVKLYQGVTLGGLMLDSDCEHEKQKAKRHPTLEDDVTVLSGTTIVGGDTVIGRGSLIAGNIFIATSIPPMKTVSVERQHLTISDRKDAKAVIFHDYDI